MTTQPVMLQPGVSHARVLGTVSSGTRDRVRECNAIAGDSLWVISRTGGPLCRVTVESATCSGDRIECSFDIERGFSCCAPGPAVRREAVALCNGGGKARCCGGREYDARRGVAAGAR